MPRTQILRTVVLPDGSSVQIPAYIQRIDDSRTHGWQLRYGKWTFFSDGDGGTDVIRKGLITAIRELRQRIDSLDAPTGLRRHRNQNKISSLPAGISGPIERKRAGRLVGEVSYGVTVPRFGQKPTNRMVYIGTTNTINPARMAEALARAVKIREDAVAEYQIQANEAKRQMLGWLVQFEASVLPELSRPSRKQTAPEMLAAMA